ncbi:WD repeat-containing protein WDS homolog [Andrographis paniculata]|uniref:WD repeat-containing protein WDS homolog n=1 Tax=Andrographis paniculata TaxID=175694 RepID=UPI0021E82B82|nr:WD repeat-containing protein WDS homolog [Andrographis paniculata]XP_051120455.1 WD repeat-containing protein WDS homolog [Andrographis paniculata]XP_051120456.1 WD repeat-containing protein WDS homolog [Andrographis paniculata]
MENIGITVGPKGMIKKNELVRIIIQCLYSLGYVKSVSCLESESGITCKSSEFGSLERQVLNANWDDCIENLDKLSGLSDETRASALFLVLEQCLLEHLNSGEISLALDILRKKFSTLKVGKEMLHKLSHELLLLQEWGLGCMSGDEIAELRRRLVSKLEKVLPPPITLPERRLEHLVEMAVCSQIDGCIHHCSSEKISLYTDHRCSRNQFPTETTQILTDHQNEVWFVQFSNSGKYLASASRDCTAIIWKVQDDNRVTLEHMLRSHKNPVSFVAWSPDDTMLLTCGNIEVLKLWDVETGTCKRTFGDEGFIVSSCAWFPDSKRLVCGSSDPKKGIYMWDCEGNEIKAWKGMRMPKVLDLAVTPDGENLISIFSDKEIRILNLTTSTERVVSEEHSITSLSVSEDSEFLIVNLNSQEIHMWDVAGRWSKPQKYTGHRQQKYVIRSCFGGLNNMFIASGSEDSKVYIWNRRSSHPIEILSGHKMTVNCVSWNPRRPEMLASASDDNTIRIWTPIDPKRAK